MAQAFTVVPSGQTLAASLTPLQDRDDAAASCFAGTAFPSANLLLGQLCYRTDQLKQYQLVDVAAQTWLLVYDFTAGYMVAPVAAQVAWSGVTGAPTTLAGYGITDALPKGGGNATGKIGFVASGSGAASINLPHGTAPTSPVNGDVWTTTTSLVARINGNTRTMASLEAAESFSGKKTFPASGTGAASLNVPAGAAPTSPVNGDLWATTTQLVYRMNGVSKNVAFWDASSIMPVANGGTGSATGPAGLTNLGAGTAATKNLAVGTTAPATPATGDLWVDTN